MNELIFFVHILALITFILVALRLGRETLMTVLVIQIILGNLFVTKQIRLFGLDVTCSEVYMIGAAFSLNLLQTYFEKKAANKALVMTFLLLFFMIVMSQIHLRYLPSKHDITHSAFITILNNTPRIMITSFFCAVLMQKLDVELFGLFKKKFSNLPFFIPFSCASLITQFFDTVLFSFFALYGIVHSMKDIILMNYLIKVIVIFLIIPFTTFVKRLTRHDSVQI